MNNGCEGLAYASRVLDLHADNGTIEAEDLIETYRDT
jgi:hypothetical protein